MQKILYLYPNMCKIIFKLPITFPTLYLVEAGFSAVNQILAKKNNSLENFDGGNICLMFTKI